MPQVARARFEGFGPQTLDWFDGLEEDNSRAYFDATRHLWEEQVRDPFAALLTELRVEFGGEVKLFRQYRDVRFSADKSPYKATTYGLLYDVPATAAGLYAEISGGGLYAGTGYHDMAKDQLERYLVAVADDEAGPALEEAVAKVEGEGLQVAGEVLKTAPRGYPRDHPRVRFLRHKELIAGTALPSGPELTSRAALDFVAATWRAAQPITTWLDRHVGDSTLTREERWGRRRPR